MTAKEQRAALVSILEILDKNLHVSGIQNIESIYRCAMIVSRLIQSIDTNAAEAKN